MGYFVAGSFWQRKKSKLPAAKLTESYEGCAWSHPIRCYVRKGGGISWPGLTHWISFSNRSTNGFRTIRRSASQNEFTSRWFCVLFFQHEGQGPILRFIKHSLDLWPVALITKFYASLLLSYSIIYIISTWESLFLKKQNNGEGANLPPMVWWEME